MIEPNIIKDPLFYFWIALSYLILLFHSFNIPEISKKIKGVETLFISGVIGYFLTQLTRIIVFPINEIVSKEIEAGIENLPLLIELPNFPTEGRPLNSIIDFVSLDLFLFSFGFILIIGIIVLLLEIIRYCLDPDGIIFRKYERFAVIDESEILRVLSIRIPFLLIFIGMLIMSIGLMIATSLKIASSSSIIDLVYWIFSLGIGIFAFIISIYIIVDSGQIYSILPVIIRKTLNYHKNYYQLRESDYKHLFKFLSSNIVRIAIFFLFMPFVLTLREYVYGRTSLAYVGLYFIILLAVIFYFYYIRNRN